MPISLTQEMKDAFETALADGAPALVATASSSGLPDIAYKGSVMVWDEDRLAFWERAHGMTLDNLRANPQACVLYRNAKTRLSWKFWGTISLEPAGDLREAVRARTNPLELERDPENKGIAVMMRVDRVTQMGQVLMQRD